MAAGKVTERDFAEIAARSFADGARSSPHSLRPGVAPSADELLAEPYACPRRCGRTTCQPVSDGAAAMIQSPRRRRCASWASPVPARIQGFDHRVDPHYLGNRDLTVSESTRLAGEAAGVGDRPGRGGRALRDVQPRGARCCAPRWGWATTST